MKRLSIVLMFFSGFAYGQSETWNFEPVLLELVEISEELTLGLNGKYFQEANTALTFQNFDTWLDKGKVQHFTPNQFLFNSVNGFNWGTNTEIIMGSVMSQQLKLGNVRFTQNYVFDVGGNLRNSQLTIRLGEN